MPVPSWDGRMRIHGFNDKSKHLVIDLMDEQRNVTDKGGTMRLGAYPCVLSEEQKHNRSMAPPKSQKDTVIDTK